MVCFETTLYLTAREVFSSLKPLFQGFSVGNQECSWNEYILLRYQFWGSHSGETMIYIPRYVAYCLASELLGGVEVVRFDSWISTLLAETWTLIIRKALDQAGWGHLVLSGPIFAVENPATKPKQPVARDAQDLVADIVIIVKGLNFAAADN